MAGHLKGRKRAVLSFAILFTFAVSVAGQELRTSVESHGHAVGSPQTGSRTGSAGHDFDSLESARATTPAQLLSGGQSDAADGTAKDLKGFFFVGFIINILLIGAFLFWAVGQWRKMK